ncbi:MAG: hypothetical protein ACRD3W_11890 [Terriglobales bacterium]
MQCFKANDERLAMTVGASIFAAMGLVQLWRLFSQTQIMLGTNFIPFWLSGVAAAITLGMAAWFAYLIKRIDHPAV